MKITRIPKKYLGAFKQGHRQVVREYIDDELSIILLARLRRHPEYYRNVVKKGDQEALHNSDELVRSCHDRQNAMNRDKMAVERHERDDIYLEIIKKY